MGQGDVLKLLKEDEWMTVKDVSDLTETGRSSVSQNLKRLYEQGEILKRVIFSGRGYHQTSMGEYKLKIVRGGL